jgi:antitoxin component YwqK of YwqJK toxin-antitoxin module
MPRAAAKKAKKAPRRATKNLAKKAARPAPRAQRHHRRDGSLESVGRTVAGAKVGPWRFYHHDGKTLKATGRYDEDGLFTGLWKWFAANGALRQRGRFEKGEQVGPWKRWFGGTEQLCDVGRYVAGKRTGEWVFFDKKGRVRRRQTFR